MADDPLIPAPSWPHDSVAEYSLMREGQRRVNLIWERTQASIAVLIVLANIAAWVVATMRGHETSVPPGLTDALFVVVGFYYGRTNHESTGGVGSRRGNETR